MRRFGRLFYILAFTGIFVVLGARSWDELPSEQRSLASLARHLASPMTIIGLFLAAGEIIRLLRSHGYALGGLRVERHYNVELIGDADLTLEPIEIGGKYLISITCPNAESVTAISPNGEKIKLTQSGVSGTGLEVPSFELWRQDPQPRSHSMKIRALYHPPGGTISQSQNVDIALRIYGRCEIEQLPESVDVEERTAAFPVIVRSE